METQQFEIDKAQSTIEWVGRKVTGAHNGTIAIKNGSLDLNNGKLIGGKVVIDTTAIQILDVSDPATNAQFAGHLASADFFASEKFPEALLNIVSVNDQTITGDLTIKGIIQPISFEAAVLVKDETLTASAKIVIDRTKYDIKFRSGNFFTNLGDTLIYNDFDLNISLTAKAAVFA